MHSKHLILAVVYDRFLFHASIASKSANDKVVMLHVGLYRGTNFPFILDERICDIAILKMSAYLYTSSSWATVGLFDFCRCFLHHFLNLSCWSDADGACVLDRLLGRLVDDSVVIGGDNKHSCTGRDTSDEDGTAAHDDLHQQFIKINIRQKRPGARALASPYVFWSFYISDTCVAIALA